MNSKAALFLLVILVFLSGKVKAQEIAWDKFSFGFTVQYLKTNGDLNKYWGNSAAGGALLNYNIGNSFSLEGGILGAYMKPKDSLNDLPNFIFLNIPAGVKYSLALVNELKINSFAGIQNHSFIYSGEAAELVEDNDIEHELGIFFQLGIELQILNDIGIELNSKIQNVFTSPEQLKIINFGLSLYFY